MEDNCSQGYYSQYAETLLLCERRIIRIPKMSSIKTNFELIFAVSKLAINDTFILCEARNLNSSNCTGFFYSSHKIYVTEKPMLWSAHTTKNKMYLQETKNQQKPLPSKFSSSSRSAKAVQIKPQRPWRNRGVSSLFILHSKFGMCS